MRGWGPAPTRPSAHRLRQLLFLLLPASWHRGSLLPAWFSAACLAVLTGMLCEAVGVALLSDWTLPDSAREVRQLETSLLRVSWGTFIGPGLCWKLDGPGSWGLFPQVPRTERPPRAQHCRVGTWPCPPGCWPRVSTLLSGVPGSGPSRQESGLAPRSSGLLLCLRLLTCKPRRLIWPVHCVGYERPLRGRRMAAGFCPHPAGCLLPGPHLLWTPSDAKAALGGLC